MGRKGKAYRGPERRKYVRFNPSATLAVQYRLVDAGAEDEQKWRAAIGTRAQKAHSHSVSGGGLFIRLGSAFNSEVLGDLLMSRKHLALEIRLPRACPPVGALAKVMWVEGGKDGGNPSYGLGLSFVAIDERDRDSIIDYVIDSHLAGAKKEAGL